MLDAALLSKKLSIILYITGIIIIVKKVDTNNPNINANAIGVNKLLLANAKGNNHQYGIITSIENSVKIELPSNPNTKKTMQVVITSIKKERVVRLNAKPSFFGSGIANA